MNIDVFPRSLLEQVWQADKTRFSPTAADPPLCLRCGRPLAPRLSENLPSCRAAVHICRACGREELRRGGYWEPVPLTTWHAVRSGRLEGLARRGVPLLAAGCPFAGLLNGARSPAGAPALRRREVRGVSLLWACGRWWLMSADPRLPAAEPADADTIQAFARGLTALPELQNLETMAHFCLQQARPAEIPAAFDLYCQTDRLNIWLRLAVHPMEYRHIWVRCYTRDPAAAFSRT